MHRSVLASCFVVLMAGALVGAQIGPPPIDIIGVEPLEFGEIVNPAGMRTIGDFPNLTAAMEQSGWPEARIRGVIGGNWLRFLADAWGG